MRSIVVVLMFFVIYNKTFSSNKLRSKDSIFVLIDNSSKGLYKFNKNANNTLAKIKILHFDKKEKGFIHKNKSQSSNDIIYVESEPNNINFYEFESRNVFIISSIEDLEVHKIESVSKHKEEVWTKFPYNIFFIEKLNCNSYRVWEMTLVFNE